MIFSSQYQVQRLALARPFLDLKGQLCHSYLLPLASRPSYIMALVVLTLLAKGLVSDPDEARLA